MKDFIINLFEEYLAECEGNIERFRHDAMDLIRSEAIELNIEFEGYYQKKWEMEAENVMTFDSDYFEDTERRDLYVFLAALINQDIYDLLTYIWPIIYNEDISENLLHREIYLLKEKGVKF